MMPCVYSVIFNLSLSTGVVPNALKVATLLPTLKKSDADFEQFQNFRPISNLKVVSKFVEKAVTIQLTDHVMAHHLDETFQSAYKNFHSTETALVKVQNDILCAIDSMGLLYFFYWIGQLPSTRLITRYCYQDCMTASE